MKNTIKIYHGSSAIIESPQLGLGRKNNDYGRGFYCTESIELAKEWACTSSGGGFCNCYDLDTTLLNVLDLNSGDYSVLNWMAVLVEHRLFSIGAPVAGKAKKYLIDNFGLNVNAYDVIKGWRADDAYYDFADAFLNNAITVEQLSKAMLLGDLGEQVVLKSQLAFDCLTFTESIRAEGGIYYPKRKARMEAAEKGYYKVCEETADGLYVIDLMREGVNNDDTRIPRTIRKPRHD